MAVCCGSFGTPWLAKAISMDNLMWAYLVMSGLGAIIVKVMGQRFPSILIPEKRSKKNGRTSFLGEFKKIGPLLKESTLVRILVVITLLPNVVIPIINYQFNYVVDETFATEGKMIAFFAYFRGFMNIISFVILMFVGKLYGKMGPPCLPDVSSGELFDRLRRLSPPLRCCLGHLCENQHHRFEEHDQQSRKGGPGRPDPCRVPKPGQTLSQRDGGSHRDACRLRARHALRSVGSP